ncbi:MAG: PAS domain S-box protein [Acidobacteria bacterium]|nr:MAG: PAS domain S-box protein [Acidobacteriota bacterium]REK11291.1 MAG: PAS domain S-box protein [Acidobacteriota bacterium]
MAVAVPVTLGALYYRYEVHRIETNRLELLRAVAERSAKRIGNWRRERLREAENLADRPGVRDLGRISSARPAEEDNTRQLETMRRGLRSYGYDNALVVDASATIVFNADPNDEVLPPATRELLARLEASDPPTLSQPHRDPRDGRQVVDVVAPVAPTDDGAPLFLVLRSGLTELLEETIYGWPTASGSGEMLLFRSDDESVVLFAGPKRDGEILSEDLLLPLATPQLPAARTLRGEGPGVNGIDYRGRQVVAYSRPIEGSDWFLLAKIDRAEVVSEARRAAWLATLITLLLSAVAATSTLLLFARRREHFYREKLDLEQRVRESESRFQRVFENDHTVMLISELGTGQIVEANPAAIAFYGWSLEELRAKRLSDLSAPGGATDPKATHAVGRHLLADGEERHVETHSGEISIEGRREVFTIVLDVSERLEIERQRIEADNLRRLAGRVARLGGWSVELQPEVKVSWSDEVCAIHEMPPGFTPALDEAIDFYAPAHRDKVQTLFERCATTGEPFDFELELDTATGRRLWVRSIGEAERNEAGEIVRVRGAFQDITERKRREGQVLTLIQTSLDGYFACDLQGNFEEVNDSLCEMLGRSRSELLESSLRSFELADDEPTQSQTPASIDGVVERVVASGRASCRLRQRRRQGSTVEMEVSCSYLPILGERIYAFVRDVTQQLETERRLQQERARYRRIFEEVPISIWEEDWSEVLPIARAARHSGTDDFASYFAEHPEAIERALQAVQILDLNQASVELFEAADKQHLLGSLEIVFSDPSTLPGFVGEMVALSQGLQMYETEMRLVTLAGHPIDVLLRMTFPAEDDTDGIVFVSLVDITERKRQERQLATALAEAERSNRELEQFAYVASHDLQEPLRMVASYTDLLARRYSGALDERADRYIRFATDGARRMQQLIQDLLQFSRIQTRAQEAKWTDANRALERALANLDTALGEAGARVTHDELPTVMAEPTHLVQLFQNLIGNAVKFQRPGVTPEVHVGAREHQHNWAFEVRDNGIGIDPKYEQKVFAIFQRLHTREEYPGTGIGLAICRRIVERQGGTITFRSQPGEGTTFVFTVPKPIGVAT